jgi:tetratricopeptide (TPR) repeat protein
MSTLAEQLSELNRDSRWEASAVLVHQHEAEALGDPAAAWDAGWALFRLDRFEDALRFFERADQLDPSKPTGSWGRGLALRELRRFDEAEQHLRRSIQCKSSYLNRMALALVYLQTDRPDEAESCHLEGLAERRTRERLENYADFLSDTGRSDDEKAILQEAAHAPIESRRDRNLAER